MYELIRPAPRRILIDGVNILDTKTVDGILLRSRVGMVFQKPTPFPMSIWDNVAFGLKLKGLSKSDLEARVVQALQGAALWDEVKDRVKASGLSLSGAATTIVHQGACGGTRRFTADSSFGIDPIATARIEDLIRGMRGKITVVIVTHNMQQAARVSDYTAFFYMGELVEHAPTDVLFTRPKEQRTEDYITGRFG
jgi:phosphate transport system ATP-binding protein